MAACFENVLKFKDIRVFLINQTGMYLMTKKLIILLIYSEFQCLNCEKSPENIS